MILKKIHSLFNPNEYHGWGKNKRFFEGWYYKVISNDGKHAFAFIPGIAMDNNKKQQAFIQVLDGKKHTAEYHKFAPSNFTTNSGKFEIKIKENLFNLNQITIDLPSIKGQLNFSEQVEWPNSFFSPGIMGPFSFVPFMECYHGVISMNHSITGKLEINNETIDFDNGKGYIEKDWGRSFPSAYFWMQSNHFSTKNASLKVSVAKIPWLGSSFVGFIAGLWIEGKLYQFTTYNFTRLKKSFANKDYIEIVMENKNNKLLIKAKRDHATVLASPINGFMDGRIEESMNGKITVQLYDKKRDELIFNDTGINAGIEVAGNIKDIILP